MFIFKKYLSYALLKKMLHKCFTNMIRLKWFDFLSLYKTTQVDSVHLSKVKTKFEEVRTPSSPLLPHPLRWTRTLVSCPSPTTAPSHPYQGAGRPHPRPSSKPLYAWNKTPFTHCQSVLPCLLHDCSSIYLWPQYTQKIFNLCPLSTLFVNIHSLDVLPFLYQDLKYPHPCYSPYPTSPFEFASPGYILDIINTLDDYPACIGFNIL